MKASRIINKCGVILTIELIIFGISFPGYISDWAWLSILTILCLMMIYKTKLNWINIIGLIVALILSIFYTINEEIVKSYTTGIPGFLFIIILSFMITYQKKTKNEEAKKQ